VRQHRFAPFVAGQDLGQIAIHRTQHWKAPSWANCEQPVGKKFREFRPDSWLLVPEIEKLTLWGPGAVWNKRGQEMPLTITDEATIARINKLASERQSTACDENGLLS
jgi:hypothetical protein